MRSSAARARKLLKLFRDAGTGLTIVLLLAELASALLPAAVGVGLVGVVRSIENAPSQGILQATVWPLLVFTGILLLGYLADSLIPALGYLAQSRIDGAHRARLSDALAACQSLELLDQPEIQKSIRMVEADPRLGLDGTPGQGAVAQLRLFANRSGLVGALLILFAVAWYLPLVVLVPAVASQWWRSRQTKQVAELWQESVEDELHADVWRRATVNPGAAKEIRIFGLSRWSVERMQGHIRAANLPLWNYIDHISRWHWVQLTFAFIGIAPAIVVATVTARTLGSVALLSATLTAAPAVFSLIESGGATHWIMKGAAVLDRFESLQCQLHNGTRQPPKVEQLNQTGPVELAFQNVSFAYPTADAEVLRDLSFRIKAGERVALVGINGAGKSTLVKLLAGFYQPNEGQITVDGADLADLDLASWRRRTAIILQDFVHYPLSLADNITSLQADDRQDLAAVVAESGLQPLVDELPQGLDTALSTTRDGGADLSGGQWQRVALARALAAVRRGAGLIVLDEPTAHLDIEAEIEIFQALAQTRGKVSMLLISHRLNTVRGADRIVVLSGGQIVEEGTHAQLMALAGRYAEMFELQASRFRTDEGRKGASHA